MLSPEKQKFNKFIEEEDQNQDPLLKFKQINDQVLIELQHLNQTEATRKLRSIILVDVLKKMSHFKHSPTSRKKVLEYLIDEGRRNKQDLKYNFATERDTLNLKVLSNILYQELDNVIQNCVLKDQKYGEYIKRLKSKVKNLETYRTGQNSSSRSGINSFDR